MNYFFWRQPRLQFLAILPLLFPVVFLLEVLLYKLVAKHRGLFSQIFFPSWKKA